MSLPRGRRDLLEQLALWASFALAYELARGLADRGSAVALTNAERVVAIEHHLGGLYDLDLQRLALGIGGPLVQLADWTYWLSQFAFLAVAVAWVYVRHHEAYPFLRNTIFAVNVVGLIGYIALPTAPPRLLPGAGYADTLATSSVTFHSGLIRAFANPYAAMPSLHAADALVLGVTLAAVTRPALARIAFLLWPAWVWFALLVTGNHFWLDVVTGAALAAIGLAAAALAASRRRSPPPDAARRAAPWRDRGLAHRDRVGDRARRDLDAAGIGHESVLAQCGAYAPGRPAKTR